MNYEELLQQYKIRPTAVRMLILKGIDEFAAPFSLEELYVFLDTIDRSTVFRTLVLFEEQHLLHSFEDGSGKKKYCFHHLHPVAGEPSHASCRHIHATCRVCGRTMCITTQEIPMVSLPDDFEVENVNYVVTGVCSQCKKE
ncbi:MAG: transcriptional repressor [Bacteroidaceae bacterium]|nr:transcriptional repressor [Bacteroidaceae bacterium]